MECKEISDLIGLGMVLLFILGVLWILSRD